MTAQELFAMPKGVTTAAWDEYLKKKEYHKRKKEKEEKERKGRD